MKTYICKILLLALTIISSTSCIEELDVNSEVVQEFNSALVVEATITDKIGVQSILLSRVYPLDSLGPYPERNSRVEVIDDNGGIYQFQESEAGKYESIAQFAAEPNLGYQLKLTTSDGNNYESSIKSFQEESQIDELLVARDFNENEVEGVSFYVNSSDPIGEERYYRYTYEETYKIIAPFYVPEDLIYTYEVVILPDGTPISIVTYSIVQKEEEQQICYKTVNSTDIIIRDTNEFVEGADIERFRVRFIGRDNWIISHRYSILVNQFTQSEEAYNYYKTLRDISGSESLLSETQPGFIDGNIKSLSNNNEQIIGFFEVASVDTRRVYFNYSDLFPNVTIPAFLDDCDITAPPSGSIGVPPDGFLINALNQGFKFYQINLDPVPLGPFLFEGGYDVVPPFCGDCRVLGNNFPPDFWEE